MSRGESPIHPRAARALIGTRAGSSHVQLTAREAEVLGLVKDGLANKQIATHWLGARDRSARPFARWEVASAVILFVGSRQELRSLQDRDQIPGDVR